MSETAESAPDCQPPADEPKGYLQWHEWAEQKSKTHRQQRCKAHGLWHEWVPK